MRFIVAVSLLLAPLPAFAGQRATYSDNSNQRLVILVADNGDARVTGPDPDQYGVVRGGQFYLVARKEGQWTVARPQDVAAAFAKVMPTIFGDAAGPTPRPAPKLPTFEPAGKGTHLGREGRLYRFRFARAAPGDQPSLFLMSEDPALKPIGAALEQFTLALTLLMGAFMGPAVEDELVETRAIFALGTPLDMAQGYKLVSLETVEVGHEAMELPATPKTIDQIAAEVEVRALTPEEMAEPPAPQTEPGRTGGIEPSPEPSSDEPQSI